MAEVLYRETSYDIIGAAQEVHRELGPGFLESVYEHALAHEFTQMGLPFKRQFLIVVTYKGVDVGEYRADFLIEGKIVLEIKACSGLTAVHEAQAIHYLKATGLRLAILLNFGCVSLQMKRLVL